MTSQVITILLITIFLSLVEAQVTSSDLPHVRILERKGGNKGQKGLDCEVESLLEANITWYRDEHPIDVTTGFRISQHRRRDSERRISMLRFVDKRADYDGSYTCHAVNDNGENVSKEVRVLEGHIECPDSHRDYCSNGGTCWMGGSTNARFCHCHEDYEGKTCQHRMASWRFTRSEMTVSSKAVAGTIVGVILLGLFITVAVLHRKLKKQRERNMPGRQNDNANATELGCNGASERMIGCDGTPANADRNSIRS